jgi:hypothetical protein
MTDTATVSPAKPKSREILKVSSKDLVKALQSKDKGLYGGVLKNFVIDP